MIVGMIAMMLLYLGGNLYVYINSLQAMATWPLAVRIIFSVLFWVASVALFLSIGLRNTSISHAVLRVLFMVGSTWLVFILYMVLAMIFFYVIAPKMPNVIAAVGSFSVTLTVLIIGYLNYQKTSTSCNTIWIRGVPDMENYRVAMISDVHLGYGTTRDDLAQYIADINSFQPDVVLIVGDLIDNSVQPVEREDMCREFERISAPDGIYYVPGNHEYISGIDDVARYIETTPVKMLRDSVVNLTPDIVLIGRDDRSNRRRATLEELMQGIGDKVTIVIDHQPQSMDESIAHGINLHLSGHTHNGQVWPLNWIVAMMYKQAHGSRIWDNTLVHVSSGISLWGPPFRIGTESEFAIIDICSAERR